MNWSHSIKKYINDIAAMIHVEQSKQKHISTTCIDAVKTTNHDGHDKIGERLQ